MALGPPPQYPSPTVTRTATFCEPPEGALNLFSCGSLGSNCAELEKSFGVSQSKNPRPVGQGLMLSFVENN